MGIHAVLPSAYMYAKNSVRIDIGERTVAVPSAKGRMTERYQTVATQATNMLTQNRSRARRDVSSDPRRIEPRLVGPFDVRLGRCVQASHMKV
jgi:hypothetical protein